MLFSLDHHNKPGGLADLEVWKSKKWMSPLSGSAEDFLPGLQMEDFCVEKGTACLCCDVPLWEGTSSTPGNHPQDLI